MGKGTMIATTILTGVVAAAAVVALPIAFVEWADGRFQSMEEAETQVAVNEAVVSQQRAAHGVDFWALRAEMLETQLINLEQLESLTPTQQRKVQTLTNELKQAEEQKQKYMEKLKAPE